MKKYFALAAAGGALALGVPAALAATDAPSTPQNTPVQSATPTPDQSRPEHGGRGDCPEKGGDEGGGSSAPSTAPGDSGTSL
jgi:uncharacterized low-complexity protein